MFRFCCVSDGQGEPATASMCVVVLVLVLVVSGGAGGKWWWCRTLELMRDVLVVGMMRFGFHGYS